MTKTAAAPSPLSFVSPAIADAVALLVIGVVTLTALATFRDYGLGWDDYTHAQMGDLLLAFYGSGLTDHRAFSFVNLYYYGGGFDMAAALIAKVLPLDLFELRRLLGAFVGIVGIAFTWRLARRAGGPPAGALAAMLLAACPLYYGHMFINAKDAPFAVAMVFLMLALTRVFQCYPRASWQNVALLGIGLGVAVGTRVLGGMAALYAAAPQLLLIAASASKAGFKTALVQFARFVLRLLPGFALAYVLMGLLWPWSVLSPLNPLHAAIYFDHFFEKPWRELYLGTLIPVPEMPWTYLPVLFGAKLPELFLALSLAGVILAAARSAKRSAPPAARAVGLLLLGAVLIPFLITLATRPALYNGVRHFLFLLPPLAILAGIAGADALEWLARRGAAALALGVLAFGLGIASPVVEMVKLHPLEYANFNRLTGGVAHARELFMLDYWGLSFKEAADKLRGALASRGEQPPVGRPWKIAVCGPHPTAQIALGPDFLPTWESVGADFALTLDEFYCRKLDAPLLATVSRDGVVFARAYDLRGRNIPMLLTIPPPK